MPAQTTQDVIDAYEAEAASANFNPRYIGTDTATQAHEKGGGSGATFEEDAEKLRDDMTANELISPLAMALPPPSEDEVLSDWVNRSEWYE